MKTFKINIKKLTLIAALLGVMLSMNISCVDDLKQEPITDVTGKSLYEDFSNYKGLLAKLYGALAVGGQQGSDGSGDVADIDGGFSSFSRLLFLMQEITTDEAVVAWEDADLPDFHRLNWTAANRFNKAMYYRLYTEIAFCNEFIKNTTDEQLATNGITGTNAEQAKVMRAEARFLRAFAYYNLLDLYGNVTLITETTDTNVLPEQISRAELFNYVESELLAIEPDLAAARSNEYGRVDQAADWTLLSRLYLNANVYTGTSRYSDVITYTEKVIAAGYSLKSDYSTLFLADNNINNPEQIFQLTYDGQKTQTYGGTTYLVSAAVGGKMVPTDFGITGGWGGLRVTPEFVDRFGASDKRGRFFTEGQTKDIASVSTFANGYGFIKYKNITSTGAAGSNTTFVDTDLPVFRLADVYLMYAEAVLRGGGGSISTALGYVNALRTRAGVSSIAQNTLTLDYILDERSRELSWEMTRRSDLIRYGYFTSGSYLWAWKGGVINGQGVDSYRALFPIPADELVVNSKLVQNPGY
ncbi:RagB/SusD family nutrient uptake outer membrane protein [Daejeonia sp. YH14]|uniref:RagB/SusD family nutrient uptake outer membrane protein n=1 Tax=Daejeonia sp. YH14 TaxID=3439042 RepID=UPI003F494A8C